MRSSILGGTIVQSSHLTEHNVETNSEIENNNPETSTTNEADVSNPPPSSKDIKKMKQELSELNDDDDINDEDTKMIRNNIAELLKTPCIDDVDLQNQILYCN